MIPVKNNLWIWLFYFQVSSLETGKCCVY